MIDFSSFFPAESNTKSLSLRRQLPRKELDPTVFSDGSSRHEKTNTGRCSSACKRDSNRLWITGLEDGKKKKMSKESLFSYFLFSQHSLSRAWVVLLFS